MMAKLGRGLTGLLVAILWYAASFGLPTPPFPRLLAGNALAAPHADPGPFVPPSGIVGWWPAEGNAQNVAGSTQGTLVLDATYQPGYVGQAFALDGVGDAVNLGNDGSLHVSSGDFTVMAWVNLSGNAVGDRSIVDKMSASGTNTDGWRLLKQDDGRFWFCLGAQADTAHGGNGCWNGAPTTVRSATAPTPGVWYHVAGVRQGSTVSIYVNGVHEGSSTFSSFTDTHAGELLLGRNAAQGAYTHGLLDEVILFNRALTSDEIIDPMLTGTPDLAVSLTHDGYGPQREILVGGSATYSVAVTNVSPVATVPAPVTVVVTLPAGLEYQSSAGGGWVCLAAWQFVTCTLDSALAPLAAPPVLSIVADVSTSIVPRTAPSDPFTASVTVQASVSHASGEFRTSNNVTTNQMLARLPPDLSVTMTHSGNLMLGGDGTYAITVRNASSAGPTVGPVTLTDVLPAGLRATDNRRYLRRRDEGRVSQR